MMIKLNDELIMDYISVQLCAEDIEIFENTLKNNAELKNDLKQAQLALDLFDKHSAQIIPEPSVEMDNSFYSMLNEHKKQKSNNKSFLKTLRDSFTQFDTMKPIFYGAAMMFMGVLMGNFYTLKKIDNHTIENNQLTPSYTNDMQKLAVVSMLQLPSANKRLQAVSLVGKSNNADSVVINALFNTLNNDSNLNVRLAVLDTLEQFTNTPAVRAGLVNSIIHQEAPMVQVAIAEMMLNLQESKAVQPLKKLLDNKDLIEPVREKLLYAINELI